MYSVFFFQAEDGIRDYKVTGVQTCALPISTARTPPPARRPGRDKSSRSASSFHLPAPPCWPIRNHPRHRRSEERRVGKSVDLGGRRIIKKKKKKKSRNRKYIHIRNNAMYAI